MRSVALAIGLCSAGCATSSPPAVQTSLSIVRSQAFAAVIIPRFVNFPNSWTPTEQDVLLAEPTVQACVFSKRPAVRTTLSKYVRHYSGWTWEGRRAVRIQFFDTRHFPADKLAQALEVVDGDGETYFVVSFDVASGKCSFF